MKEIYDGTRHRAAILHRIYSMCGVRLSPQITFMDGHEAGVGVQDTFQAYRMPKAGKVAADGYIMSTPESPLFLEIFKPKSGLACQHKTRKMECGIEPAMRYFARSIAQFVNVLPPQTHQTSLQHHHLLNHLYNSSHYTFHCHSKKHI